MNRPRWQMPSLGSDADHGMEELQTDVMRFMAILGFCLVAIFALVQSLPFPAPAPESAPARDSVEAAPEPVAPPATAPAEPARVAAPLPGPVAPKSSEAAQPPPEAVSEPSPASAPPSAEAPAREGFSLRFASNDALRQLVIRGDVTLYAVAGESAWRMAAAAGRPSFTSASPPSQFHEMARGTVPEDLVRAVRRVGPVAGTEITWGVVLPGSTTGSIRTLVQDHSGGDLVIDSQGGVRLLGATERGS